jgi:hypothetical protein
MPRQFSRLMSGNPLQARKALEEFLTEPLKFSPIDGTKQIRVEGQVNHLTLFTTASDPTGSRRKLELSVPFEIKALRVTSRG